MFEFCAYSTRSSVVSRRRVEKLTRISRKPRMNATVNVVLSRRSFSARIAGATMKEKPAIAVSFPNIFTGLLSTGVVVRIVEHSG